MFKFYRECNSLPSAVQWLVVVAIAALYWLCCIPSFCLIGHFAAQVILSVLFSAICTAVLFLLIPRSLTLIGKGLSLYLITVLAKAFYDQILLQIKAGQLSWWQYSFFYDKPAIVSLVWAIAYVSLMMLRLFLPARASSDRFKSDYALFFRDSTGVFIFFYVCVLIYCFILQRQPGGDSGINLIPFAMIAEYIRTARFAYENIFYLLGNILCFFPFGFFMRVYRTRYDLMRVILMPVVLSVVIEASQLLLRMGHFDIDDILMNTFGFYFGYFLSYLLDWLRAKITAGEEQTIFSNVKHN